MANPNLEFAQPHAHHSQCAVSRRPATVSQQCDHPLPHLNQQTQCHTKDSGFYLYFIWYSHRNRRETAVSWRKKRPKQRHFTFVYFISPSHSPSFTISFSSHKIWNKSRFPIFTATFPFMPVFRRRRDRLKRRSRQSIIVRYSHPSLRYPPWCKQRDESIKHSVSGWD